MQTVIIVIHLMIVVVMIGAVLLQKSEGGGLGMGGGAGFMSSRGTANLLTRTTAVLACLFFLTSLGLNWLASYERRPATLIGSFQGNAQAVQTSIASQPYLIAAAIVVVYIILGMLYESYIHPITILSTLPFAGVGALLMLMIQIGRAHV